MPTEDTKLSALIIEDNSDLVDLYKTKLTNEGFLVESAKDGEEGLLKAADMKPNIILLDILTPNMNGWEVLAAIKKNTSLSSKILVISNLGSQEQIDEAMKLGADAYLVKANVTPSDIVAKAKELLGVK